MNIPLTEFENTLSGALTRAAAAAGKSDGRTALEHIATAVYAIGDCVEVGDGPTNPSDWAAERFRRISRELDELAKADWAELMKR